MLVQKRTGLPGSRCLHGNIVLSILNLFGSTGCRGMINNCHMQLSKYKSFFSLMLFDK